MKRPESMNLSAKACRLLRPKALAGPLALVCGLAWAQVGYQNSGPVLGDDVMYSIGGGSAVSMGRAAGMRSIGVGVGWNSNLICGDMSIQTTLRNQLNGVTNGFQQIMSNVIQSATSAVASLPALIIQRADPGLYNLLTNGVLQARMDFDRSKLTCRAMAEKMADTAGGQLGWSQMAEGMALRDAVSSTDAVSAIEQAETRRGNDGVPWVGGNNAGGAGQSAIRVVGDGSRAGYNLVKGRCVTDASSIAAASSAARRDSGASAPRAWRTNSSIAASIGGKRGTGRCANTTEARSVDSPRSPGASASVAATIRRAPASRARSARSGSSCAGMPAAWAAAAASHRYSTPFASAVGNTASDCGSRKASPSKLVRGSASASVPRRRRQPIRCGLTRSAAPRTTSTSRQLWWLRCTCITDTINPSASCWMPVSFACRLRAWWS